MGVPDFPLSVAGTWMPLDVEGRRQWLSSASRHYFEGGGHREFVVRPAGAVVVLDASQVTDLEGFLCALGEAVNGPGGYLRRGGRGSCAPHSRPRRRYGATCSNCSMPSASR